MPMARPDDEEKPFVIRWNSLMRVLIVDSSVKLVGRTAMDYADTYDGSRCRPSNARIAREGDYSTRTVLTAWGILRGLGLVELVREASPVRGRAAEYELQIPHGWAGLPVLGPSSQDFTCLNCGDEFTPQPKVSLNELKTDKPGTYNVRWNVRYLCFCPAPRKHKGRPGPWCFDEWEKKQANAGAPQWAEVTDKWDLFRKARGEAW